MWEEVFFVCGKQLLPTGIGQIIRVIPERINLRGSPHMQGHDITSTSGVTRK